MTWASIKPSKNPRPPRILIYGRNGVGKSYFASLAPAPVFLDLEQNVGELMCITHEDLGHKLQTFTDVLTFLKALETQEHDFKTLVVDSLDALEVMIHQAVCQEQHVRTVMDLAYGKGLALAFSLWQQFLEGLKRLWSLKGMTVLLIAHDTIARYDNPTSTSYDRHQLRLHERAASLMMDWCNCVLFATKDLHFLTEDAGWGQKLTKAQDRGRVMYTQGDCSYLAKNTYTLPVRMPLDAALFWKALQDFHAKGDPS